MIIGVVQWPTTGPYHPPVGIPIEPMACAVCGLVVDTHTREVGQVETERHWEHTAASVGTDDHLVVPVPVDWIQTNFRCDFCLDDHARWALPVEPFEVVPGSGYQNMDDWAACDICAAALAVHDWNKIIYRAMKTHKRLHGNDGTPREVFEHMYLRALKPHITGPVHLRLEEPAEGVQ